MVSPLMAVPVRGFLLFLKTDNWQLPRSGDEYRAR